MTNDHLRRAKAAAGEQIAEQMIEKAYQRQRDARGRFVREVLNRLDPVADAPNPYKPPALANDPLYEPCVDPGAVIHQKDGSERLACDVKRGGLPYGIEDDDTGSPLAPGWWIPFAMAGGAVALWLLLRWIGVR